MVGIVIVSHSFRIAEGVAELAREMGGPDIRLETAGGLDMPEHPIGTDAVLVMQAIERAWSEDGVLVLMDLGSAVLSAEMALDLLEPGQRERIQLCEAPLVEGAVAAAVTAKMGASLDAVAAEARGGLAGKITHLGTPAADVGPASDQPTGDRPEGEAVVAAITVANPHGLHARPATRFVQTASSYDALVQVRDLTNGRGPADAKSLNAIATLGAATGHELEVAATGPQAAEAIAAVQALASRNFDEEAVGPEATAPVPPLPATDDDLSDGALHGFSASPGLASGPAQRFHVPALTVPAGDATDGAAEIARLDHALEQAGADIERQRDEVLTKAGEQEAAIFSAHLLLLRDDALLAPARRAIHADHRTAAQAWQASIDTTARDWEAIEDPYLRARADDLRSVGVQVLARILGIEPPAPAMDAPGILVAADLTPADTSGLDPAVVMGIATARGGPTSHAAVLARSMGIPAVVGLGDRLMEIEDGTTLALNGDRGLVHVDPPAELLTDLEEARTAAALAADAARDVANTPAVTADGVTVEVSANVGSPEEVAPAVAQGADGVGLFRTEFLFMDRDAMPTEDEQEAAYRLAAEALHGRPLLLRTLDAGADKPLPYLGQPAEPNPFLGVRGVRLGLTRPDLLLTQLRAVVRVAADFPVRVMFPMVATTDELHRALELLDQARQAVGRAAQLETGIMVEVPAAALTAAALAPSVDFFSIGTNDLTQYVLAADRGNEHVASLSDAVHPAVLRLIEGTTVAARAHGRWVGVCGELAGDATATSLLLGLGVRELSMSAPAIGQVKQVVRSTDIPEAEALAVKALACTSASEVRALLAV
ncbi:MAG TPA: phosphoenolpyruvate--protein phosphotransferase [Actinomycetota bacterium]|nr:phosphoenolpyruvate--protein phosphotransferase [Actinomycetota bacterium]